MTPLDIIIDPVAVNRYLVAHELEQGYVPLQAVLPQYEGTSSGQPALLLVFEVDGRKVLAKTTLQLMETACSAMRSASGVPRSP